MKEISEFLGLAEGIVTILGIVVVVLQLRLSRDVAYGQFIHDLTVELNSYEALFEQIISDIDRGEDTLSNNFRVNSVMGVLNFFEKLAILERRGAVKIEDLRVLFGKRFTSIFCHPCIRRNVLDSESYRPHLKLLFELERRW